MNGIICQHKLSISNENFRVCPRMIFMCLQMMAGVKVCRTSVYESCIVIQSLACS